MGDRRSVAFGSRRLPKRQHRRSANVESRRFAVDFAGAIVTRAQVQPVLVTGATGRIGRAVVAELLDAGVPVRALTRRPATAGLPATVEVVAGDLTVPDSLDAVLQGVGAVFLIWTAPPDTARAVVEHLASHTRRVVFLSSPHQTPHPFFQQPNPAARFHAEMERLIADAGLESTFIRPGIFGSNSQFWWGRAIRGGDVVRWPYGGAETSPIDERDVAAVAARALYEYRHAGGDYVLTGPESLSQAEQVSVMGMSSVAGSASSSCRRKSSGVRQRVPGRVRSWTCCSPRGLRRSDARRT
jgi:uncharacterized protein YbjT (DUF2867 family)